jgi:hypothetical protein
LGRALHLSGLTERLAASGPEARIAAVQDHNGARIGATSDVLAGYTDSQVIAAVAVEVACREGGTEPIVSFCVTGNDSLAEGAMSGPREPAGAAVEHNHGAGVNDATYIFTGVPTVTSS